MKRLNHFLGLAMATAVTLFSAHAQDAGSTLDTSGLDTKAAKTQTVTQSIDDSRALTLADDYKPGTATPTAKKAPARKVSSASELAGTYVLTGTSLLSSEYNGCSVTVEVLGSDSVVLNDFWAPDYSTVIKGKVDVTTGTISFPSCVMGQHSTYGDILFAKTQLSDGQPLEDEDVTATIGEDGTISFNDPWGAYAKASSTATQWSYFALVTGATMEKCNATFTGKVHKDGSLTTYGLIFTQTDETTATIKNLGNYGQTVSITLNRNKTATIPTSFIAYNSTYGDFYCYSITFYDSGTTFSSDDVVTDVATDNRTLSWKNWGIVSGNTSGSNYLIASYDSCAINTTDDINYPVVNVTLNGSGTLEDPYRISNAQEWNDFAEYVTAYDMTGTYTTVTGEIDFSNETDGITPIAGDGIATFNGFLDGNNHTVSGYSFTSTAAGQGALFGTIGAQAVVSNLTAAGSATGGTDGTTKLGYVAGVVGNLYGTLKNVTNAGTVTGINTHTAGVAAYVYQGATLDSVTNTGTVSSSAAYVGGIAAYAYEGSNFNQCVNKGELSTTVTSNSYVGGIAAYALPATFNQCVNDGNINGATSAGIVAYCAGLSGGLTYIFNECVNNGDVTGNAYLGGITAFQSTTVGNNVGNYVRCVNNGKITATATSSVSSTGVAGIAAVQGAGSTFDHCINNADVTNTKSPYTAGIAAFYKGTPSETYPVTFKNCVNYGTISSQAQMAAGIVAYARKYTYLDSCYNYGDIEEGIWGAAGICYNYGDNCTMTNCVNLGDVTVTHTNYNIDYAGGVVGTSIYPASTIEGCVNLGNISIISTDNIANCGAGGIAGRTYSNITNCFNAGKITGTNRVGGIVGCPSYDASTVRTCFTNCINIGEVVASDSCGGGPILGTVAGSESTYWGDNNTCTDTYYLTDLSWRGSEASVGDYVAVGTGFSVAQLTGLDNGTAWYTADGYSFPVPLIGKNDADVLTHAAAVVLATEDTYDNVTNCKFNVGNPDGTAWTPSSSIVVIDGNDAQVNEVSQIEVTLTNKTASDSQQAPATKAYSGADGVDWILKLNVNEVGGIDDNTLGKVVAQEAYYTLNGILVDAPEATDGQIYIVVRKYTDGTMNAVKIRN